MRTLLTTVCLCLSLAVTPAAMAGMLSVGDFAGVTPEDFAGLNLQHGDYDEDFGTFAVSGWFDSFAFFIPIAPPVVLPAIGGDTVTLTLTPPTKRVGFDMGSEFSGVPIRFYGENDVVLLDVVLSDIVSFGTGPNGFGYLGFVGFEDDQMRDIHRIVLGSGDLYFDNVYIGASVVAVEEQAWSGVKALYR